MAEIVIDGREPVVVSMRSIKREPGRLLSESIALAEAHGPSVTLDGDFARDLEAVIDSHREPLNPAGMGLILDSSTAITAERCLSKSLRPQATSEPLSAVGLTELVHGIYRAQTVEARNRRESFIRELLNDVEVVPYTKDSALLAAKLDGEQQSKGVTIPFVDLLIGATTLEVG